MVSGASTTIRRIAVATREVTTVAGAVDKIGVTTGSLPGTLNGIGSLTVTPMGDYMVVCYSENAILMVRTPP